MGLRLAIYFALELFCNLDANAMRYANDKCIAHTEGALPVSHSGICPPFGEALELIEFVGD